jgi:putative ABC transport system substrate-binding protein
MRRRAFIALLGGGAAAWPLAARGQQAAMPLVGFLNSATPEGYAPMLAAFHQGLNSTGLVEGQTVAIDYRWAHDRNDRLPALAAELVQRNVLVIAANGPAAVAARAATATIPIVFFGGYDPVRFGLVASLARPGGNVTGVTILNVELIPKRLEAVRELLPDAAVVGLLVNPTNPNVAQVSAAMNAAARAVGVRVVIVGAHDRRGIEAAFAGLREARADALVISPDPFFNTRNEQFASLSTAQRLPAIYQYREFAAAGGLMSLGGDIIDLYRRVGSYTGRIVKGDKPADLPVQQTTKVELIVNLKTAKTLGIVVPQTLLARADEVIE